MCGSTVLIMDVMKFRSYEDAIDALHQKELEKEEKFILVYRKKRRPLSLDIETLDAYVIKFEDGRGEVPVLHDGIPFIQLGTEVWECHQGQNRKKKKVSSSGQDTEEHQYSGKKHRRLLQVSKKLGCTAQVKLRFIMKFPAYRLQVSESKRSRQKIANSLRSANLSEVEKEVVVLMKYCGKHHNHVLGEEARFCQPLDKKVISKIKELVRENGMRSAQEIMRCLQVWTKEAIPVSQSQPNNRKYNPSLQDVRNHMSLALNDRSIDEEGELSSLLFVHQTVFQQRLLRRYGSDIVLMDSTYKTMRYNMPLFFMSVLTNMGYLVVATFVVGRENTEEIANALTVISNWNQSWEPKGFMCDLDLREINAIERVFPAASVFTCAFHREQAWDRWLSKASNGAVASKDCVLQMLRGIANAHTEMELDEKIMSLKCSNLYISNSRFQAWVDKIWLGNIKRWARCYRSSTMAVHITTTNGIESLNRTFKHKFLHRSGASKSLSAMITIIVEDFEPKYEEEYTRQNVLQRSTSRTYNSEVPAWLHDRPHNFVLACMKRLSHPSETISQAGNEFYVGIHPVNIKIPMCDCEDWWRTGWPCKHMLALIKSNKVSWSDFPREYRELPCFCLENCNAVNQEIESELVQDVTALDCRTARNKGLELLDSARSLWYMVENPVTMTQVIQLWEKSLDLLKKVCPVLQEMNQMRRTRRRTFRVPNSRIEQAHAQERDEIDKVLDDIWNGPETPGPVVQVGPFLLRNNSFHFLLQNLSDEVIDAALYLLCGETELHAKHVPSTIWTAVFYNQSRNLHELMQMEDIYSYDLVLGAVNEGGCHWTLIIVKPHERKVVYMNPLGERKQTIQRFLQNWNYFLKSRFEENLDYFEPGTWEIETPDHTRQTDSTSCGIYVIQLAHNYLVGESLTWTWSAPDIKQTRIRLARQFIAVGESISNTVEAAESISNTVEAAESISNTVEAAESISNTVEAAESISNTVEAAESISNTVEAAESISNTVEAAESRSNNDNIRGEDNDVTSGTTLISNTSDTEDLQHISAMKLRSTKRKKRMSSFVCDQPKKQRRYCVCQEMDDGRLYWQCESCKEWFHPHCVGMDPDEEPEIYFCKRCMAKNQVKSNYVTNIEDEDEEPSENSYVFTKINMEKLIGIGIQKVAEVVSFRNRNSVWMMRHNSFKKGWRVRNTGFGYSLFSLQALHFVETTLIDHFFTDITGKAYTRHGRVKGMKDPDMCQIFEEDRHMAEIYIKEVCCREALTAIVCATLKVSVKKANKLLNESVRKTMLLAVKDGIERSRQNKEKWGGRLSTFEV